MIIRKNSARALIQPESQPIELLLQREFVIVGRRSSPKREREVRATTEAMLPTGVTRRSRFRARRWMMWRKIPMMPVVARIKARKCPGSSLGTEFQFRKTICTFH
jgi:hypothetical protein